MIHMLLIKTTSSSELCYPKKKITISTAEASSLTFNWVWNSIQGCTKLGLADKTFEKTTSVPLHFLVKEVESYGILTVNGDKANLNNLDGASCTFEKEIEKKGGSFIILLIIACFGVSRRSWILFIQKETARRTGKEFKY